MLQIYAGTLGDQTKTAVTLQFSQDKLSAILFEPGSKKNIRLNGKISNDGQFEMSNTGTSASFSTE